MQLSEWLKDRGLSYHEAAKVLDLPNASVVRAYALGLYFPIPKRVESIREKTGGAVSYADWYSRKSNGAAE
jgi:hypothetical protein